MIYRCIAPEWLLKNYPTLPRTREGEFTDDQITELNQRGYNIYFLPNFPSVYDASIPVDGTHVDVFRFVFVDMDLKSKAYTSKEQFITKIHQCPIRPSLIVDSGNGVHVYWRVSDLDAMSYLKFQRRLCRLFNTDPAVGTLFQLMRRPGSINTKNEHEPKICQVVETSDVEYTSEQLDALLPTLSLDDASYCKRHYDQTHRLPEDIEIQEKPCAKFSKLLKSNKDVRNLYVNSHEDRSKADYYLAHLLFSEGFTKDEALSVLVNCKKALERAPIHRRNYAVNLVEKIWVFEEEEPLSSSVRDILRKSGGKGHERFPCWEVYDGTHHGFRLTEVLGLIGGAGSGKTTLAMNYFYWFAKMNPSYIHVFVSLEQPDIEIAERWSKVCQGNDSMHDKVHVLTNYNEDGSYRNLTFQEVEDYVLSLEARLKTKVGCVVIDHIGVLNKTDKDGEFQGIIDICHAMKAFAKRTNTFLVMQSQTSRPKAGIGDIELDKDAAYGTSMFEWYCDYVVTTWQPLKRVYTVAPNMTCSAFKYGKIRHKNVKLDKIKEDEVYVLHFDPDTEMLSIMTEDQEESYQLYSDMATKDRNKDRKREPKRITKIEIGDAVNGGQPKAGGNKDGKGSQGPSRIH